MSNTLYTDTKSHTFFTSTSDHFPISSTMLIKSCDSSAQEEVQKTLVFKPGVTLDQIEALMRHQDFPRRPLLLIAKGLGLTTWKKVMPNKDLHALKNYINTHRRALDEIARY
jgi:hypothetical protein